MRFPVAYLLLAFLGAAAAVPDGATKASTSLGSAGESDSAKPTATLTAGRGDTVSSEKGHATTTVSLTTGQPTATGSDKPRTKLSPKLGRNPKFRKGRPINVSKRPPVRNGNKQLDVIEHLPIADINKAIDIMLRRKGLTRTNQKTVMAVIAALVPIEEGEVGEDGVDAHTTHPRLKGKGSTEEERRRIAEMRKVSEKMVRKQKGRPILG